MLRGGRSIAAFHDAHASALVSAHVDVGQAVQPATQ